MISSGRICFWMAAGIVCWLAVPSPAQNSRGILSVPEMPAARQVISKSPVGQFRELLAMEPAQRERILATRPPAIRKRIGEKLEEYQILPQEIREWRLRETELRYYLLPLMEQPRTNRAARLALIPEEPRKLVEERLQIWDLLPPDLQKEFVNSEIIRSYLSRFESAAAQEQWRNMLTQISAERRAELEQGLERWRGLSEEQRRKTSDHFNKFFELTAEEREKALDTLSDEERKQMETTLKAYAKLTSPQRWQCLQSFEKFTGMNLIERQQFLKNAERWKEMSSEERQAWRDLVSTARIMPPDLRPTPRGARGSSPSLATD